MQSELNQAGGKWAMNNLMRRYIDLIDEDHLQGIKTSKDAANYIHYVEGDNRCENCVHFLQPNHCEIVEGQISPDGWCRFFEFK